MTSENPTKAADARSNFSNDVKLSLRDRAGNQCSFPKCENRTDGPSAEGPEKTTNLGEAAHIVAAGAGNGARRRFLQKPLEQQIQDLGEPDKRLVLLNNILKKLYALKAWPPANVSEDLKKIVDASTEGSTKGKSNFKKIDLNNNQILSAQDISALIEYTFNIDKNILEKLIDQKYLCDYSNGIWLCSRCHALVDRDEVSFSIPMLIRWRELAEERTKFRNVFSDFSQELLKGHQIGLAEFTCHLVTEGDVIKVLNKEGAPFLVENKSEYRKVQNLLAENFEKTWLTEIWGKEMGGAVRDMAVELVTNEIRHGNSTSVNIEVRGNCVTVRGNGSAFSLEDLKKTTAPRGGHTALDNLSEHTSRLIIAARRDGIWNETKIAFIVSKEEVISTTACSFYSSDFQKEGFSSQNFLNCGAIYVVVTDTMVPSVAHDIGDAIKASGLQQKPIVLVTTGATLKTSEKLEKLFPNCRVMTL